MTYGLTLTHKHVPEMHCYSGTRARPLFTPIVGHYYKGMLVHVPLANEWLNGASPERIHAILSERYADEPCVNVLPLGAEAALDDGYLSPLAANDTNRDRSDGVRQRHAYAADQRATTISARGRRALRCSVSI